MMFSERLQFVLTNLSPAQLWGFALFALLGFGVAYWRWHRPLRRLTAEREALLRQIPEDERPIDFGLGNAPLLSPSPFSPAEPGSSDPKMLEDLLAQRDEHIAALSASLEERTREVDASRAEAESLRSSVAVVTALASTCARRHPANSPAAFPLEEVTAIDDPDEQPAAGTTDYAPLLEKYSEETISVDSGLGIVFPDPPENPDDLTRIKGIGEPLQEKLNSFGIYRYQQIADWTPYNVWMVNRRLAFTGRVQREQWVQQAALLLKKFPQKIAS